MNSLWINNKMIIIKWIFKLLKKTLRLFGKAYWRLKCFISIRIEGMEGLSRMIESMPQFCLIAILRKYGASIGDNCLIERGLIVHRPKGKVPLRNLILGDNVYIGHKNIFDLSEKVIICHDSGFGAYCQYWTHTGDWPCDTDRKCEKDRIGSIQIGTSVICYSSVIIGPGVVIGDDVRVAAGSVVTKNIEPKTIYGGAPAKLIKKRDI
jgi:acetyltransferase-like isoleucine patch superfamily enzyme